MPEKAVPERVMADSRPRDEGIPTGYDPYPFNAVERFLAIHAESHLRNVRLLAMLRVGVVILVAYALVFWTIDADRPFAAIVVFFIFSMAAVVEFAIIPNTKRWVRQLIGRFMA